MYLLQECKRTQCLKKYDLPPSCKRLFKYKNRKARFRASFWWKYLSMIGLRALLWRWACSQSVAKSIGLKDYNIFFFFFFQNVVTDMYALRMTLYLISKFLISISFCILFVYTVEMFPTELRQTLGGFASTVGRIGSIIAPQTILMVHLDI